MKKTFVKISQKLIAVLLVMMMLVSAGGNFAFAASAGPNVASKAGNVDEAKAITEMVSSAVFFSTGKVYELDPDYWTLGSDPQYDYFSGTTMATFKLSNYAKISRLMNILMPAYDIPYAIDFLTKYNQLSSLKMKIFSGQTGTIWSFLSTTTQRQIANMDAEHALKHIKRKPEYTQNANLRKYVDTHLEQTLSGRQLRTGLNTILPAYSSAINQWSIRSLLNFAKCVVNTPQYQQLYVCMREIASSNCYDVQSLVQRYSSSEAKVKELGLSLAADYYLHDAVYTIETLQITLPAKVSYRGTGPITGSDEQISVPSVPVAVEREPKHYR